MQGKKGTTHEEKDDHTAGAKLVLMMHVAPAAFAKTFLGGWENIPREAGVLPEDTQAAFDKALEGGMEPSIPRWHYWAPR